MTFAELCELRDRLQAAEFSGKSERVQGRRTKIGGLVYVSMKF